MTDLVSLWAAMMKYRRLLICMPRPAELFSRNLRSIWAKANRNLQNPKKMRNIISLCDDGRGCELGKERRQGRAQR